MTCRAAPIQPGPSATAWRVPEIGDNRRRKTDDAEDLRTRARGRAGHAHGRRRFPSSTCRSPGARCCSTRSQALAAVRRIDHVIAVLSPLDRHWGAYDWSAFPDKIEACFAGGATRGASVANALAPPRRTRRRATTGSWSTTRRAPASRHELVERFLDEVGDDPVGGLLAMPLADTLKRAQESMRVAGTVSREGLWRAQTPQMFRFGALQARPRAHAGGDRRVAGGGVPRRQMPRIVQGERREPQGDLRRGPAARRNDPRAPLRESPREGGNRAAGGAP